MSKFFFKFFIQYFYYIPNWLVQILSNKRKKVLSQVIFDTVQYQLEYKGSNLLQFFIPLVFDISQISANILKHTQKKKLISIISILTIHEKENNIAYTHSLFGSDKLYSYLDANNWAINLLHSLVEKLEVYTFFKKISILIKVKEIKNI